MESNKVSIADVLDKLKIESRHLHEFIRIPHTNFTHDLITRQFICAARSTHKCQLIEISFEKFALQFLILSRKQLTP